MKKNDHQSRIGRTMLAAAALLTLMATGPAVTQDIGSELTETEQCDGFWNGAHARNHCTATITGSSGGLTGSGIDSEHPARQISLRGHQRQLLAGSDGGGRRRHRDAHAHRDSQLADTDPAAGRKHRTVRERGTRPELKHHGGLHDAALDEQPGVHLVRVHIDVGMVEHPARSEPRGYERELSSRPFNHRQSPDDASDSG